MATSYNTVLSELDSDWVSLECEGADFGDKRLDSRLAKTLSRMAAQPSSPLNQSCATLGETLASYRFIDNEKISPTKILEPHAKQSVLRAEGEDVVLCIQDTSTIKLNGHSACEGIGYVGRETLKGLFLHSLFSILPSGIPLGLLDMRFHTRENITRRKNNETKCLSTQDKESGRWLESAKKTKGLFSEDTMVVHVCDREADIFDFYTCVEAQNDYFLVRAKNNRLTEEEDKLFELVDEQKPVATVTYEIPSKGGRAKRRAKLQVKFVEASIKPPIQHGANAGRKLSPINVWCIEVREINPPEDEPAVCWKLLTNVPVDGVEEALEKVLWYTKRWAIEEMHKILKSCCRVEKAQFQTIQRMSNYIALRSIVAWRIYYLVHINRINPKASADSVLTESEIQTLELLNNNKRRKQGKKGRFKIKTAKQALTEIAKLGGFLDRKNDLYPGITVVWRGLTVLAFAMEGVSAAQNDTYV